MPQTKEQREVWYQANKEKMRAYNAAYHAAHREEIALRRLLGRKNNPEKTKLINRTSKEKNKERVAETARIYRINNKEKLAKIGRDYRKRFPFKVRMKAHKRRAVIKGVFKEKVEPLVVFERNGWICQLCDDPVDKNLKHPDRGCAVVDHIQPLKLGGIHAYSNVQLAHHGCNLRKNARPIMKLSKEFDPWPLP